MTYRDEHVLELMPKLPIDGRPVVDIETPRFLLVHVTKLPRMRIEVARQVRHVETLELWATRDVHAAHRYGREGHDEMGLHGEADADRSAQIVGNLSTNLQHKELAQYRCTT